LPADADFLGELLKWSAGLVASYKVVGIRQFDFSGHVYDLESETGWLFACSILASNCKCRVRQISPQEAEEKGGVTPAPDSHLVPWENIRNGQTEYAPVGVHPAFAYNPGKNRTAGLNEALAAAEVEQQ
jgi:hypothetical protein